MNTKIIRILIITATLLGCLPASQAIEAPKEDQAFSEKIISSIQESDYKAFVADGDEAFKKLKKEQFDSVAAILAPRFKSGYEVVYLGELKQHGARVTLWKLSFKDGKDDALATLSVKNGKVGGFWIK
jgi:DNA-binding response OmpR family regulator